MNPLEIDPLEMLEEALTVLKSVEKTREIATTITSLEKLIAYYRVFVLRELDV